MTLAVIPARGGSKRIPRKNIRPFCGKPIIAYSIEAARQSGLFDRVIVSTDDDEIARTAERWGAEVPFRRPAELADDHTGTNAVVRHALQWFWARGHEVAHACCIYATAPFLTPETILLGWRRLLSSDGDFVFSATTFAFPIWRAVRVLPDGGVEPIFPDLIDRRSQDLEEVCHDAGQFYWGRSEAFLAGKPLFSAHTVPLMLPRHTVQDIDTEEDWARAERMFLAWGKRKGQR